MLAIMDGILKYYDGSKPGKRNKPDATQNESANKRKEYELKRTRAFMQHFSMTEHFQLRGA